ncbi:hypothetical protein C0993_011364, partial [Termitomyces sp. T159_Od127]
TATRPTTSAASSHHCPSPSPATATPGTSQPSLPTTATSVLSLAISGAFPNCSRHISASTVTTCYRPPGLSPGPRTPTPQNNPHDHPRLGPLPSQPPSATPGHHRLSPPPATATPGIPLAITAMTATSALASTITPPITATSALAPATPNRICSLALGLAHTPALVFTPPITFSGLTLATALILQPPSSSLALAFLPVTTCYQPPGHRPGPRTPNPQNHPHNPPRPGALPSQPPQQLLAITTCHHHQPPPPPAFSQLSPPVTATSAPTPAIPGTFPTAAATSVPTLATPDAPLACAETPVTHHNHASPST